MIKKALLILTLIITLVVVISSFREGSEMKDEKIKMQEWLKEEYGKEFVVESVEHYTEYLGAPKEIQGKAHAIDDKEFVFDIRKFEDGHMWTLGEINSQYNERYLWLLWEKQAKENMKNLVSPKNYSIRILAHPDDIYPYLEGKSIDLSKAREKFKNKISIEIDCALFEDNTDTRLDTIFSIINAYKDTSYEQISLNVLYLDKAYEKDVEKEVEKSMYSVESFYCKIKKKNNVKIEYKITNINTIKAIEEISSYIVKE